MESPGRCGQGATLFRAPDRRRADLRPDAEGARMDDDRHGAEVERRELRGMPQVKIRTWAYWGRILFGNVLASVVVVFAFSDATLSTPPLQLLRVFGVSFLFSCCIAALLGLTMP